MSSPKIIFPKSIRSNLPREAQDIYVHTYKNTWNSHEHLNEQERAAKSHIVAWSTLKQNYQLADGAWLKK